MLKTVSCVATLLLSACLAYAFEWDAAHYQAIANAKETHVFKTVGGCELRADVYGAAKGEKRPAVLWLHGGGLIMGSRKGVDPVFLVRFVDAGYVVVSVDYRLAPETKLPGIVEDVADAYAWLRKEGPERFGVDADRIAVGGGSAGGYLTLMAGICCDPPPRALVPKFGYSDFAGAWCTTSQPPGNEEHRISKETALASVGTAPIAVDDGKTGRNRSYTYGRQNGIWPDLVSGFDVKSEPEAMKPYSPVKNVTAAYPPTILLHGDKDVAVPVSESQNMAAELERHGVPCEMIVIKNGGHGFKGADVNDILAAQERVMAFLAKHLAQQPAE